MPTEAGLVPTITPVRLRRMQNNPVMRQDPTGMLDVGILEEGTPGGTFPADSDAHNTNTSEALNTRSDFFSGVKDFFKKSWNWIQGKGFYIPDGSAEEWMIDEQANLDEIVIIDGGCYDCDNTALYMFGTGANGVESWNEDLKPSRYVDMNDPFWNFFTGFGQKGLFKDGLGSLDEKIRDLTKTISDVASILLTWE